MYAYRKKQQYKKNTKTSFYFIFKFEKKILFQLFYFFSSSNRYFQCKPNHGIFAPLEKVKLSSKREQREKKRRKSSFDLKEEVTRKPTKRRDSKKSLTTTTAIVTASSTNPRNSYTNLFKPIKTAASIECDLGFSIGNDIKPPLASYQFHLESETDSKKNETNKILPSQERANTLVKLKKKRFSSSTNTNNKHKYLLSTSSSLNRSKSTPSGQNRTSRYSSKTMITNRNMIPKSNFGLPKPTPLVGTSVSVIPSLSYTSHIQSQTQSLPTQMQQPPPLPLPPPPPQQQQQQPTNQTASQQPPPIQQRSSFLNKLNFQFKFAKFPSQSQQQPEPPAPPQQQPQIINEKNKQPSVDLSEKQLPVSSNSNGFTINLNQPQSVIAPMLTNG